MKKSVGFLFFLIMMAGGGVRAEQGMWIPSLIASQLKDMKAKGMQLSAEDIYSINQASLKDAIVLFGGGCTGEVVSYEGLMLTNHHCGYYFIGRHSSVQNDYLSNGFWAMNPQEELPCEGLSVSFLISIEEVTTQILSEVTDGMEPWEREQAVSQKISQIVHDAQSAYPGYKANVESYYYDNQYFLILSETFRDVRLVGAPPCSIGKFGGDTDNWMWPRHTGDFAVFRIYANSENQPADYSSDNIPYRPRKALTISTQGVQEDDFTMVYGFPGRTQQYLISDAIDYVLNVSNPHKIALRTMRLEVMNSEQAKDPAVRIAYAAQNARVANAWKKWQGESKGLKRLGTIEKKKVLEADFEAWAAGKKEYDSLLPQMRRLYAQLEPYALAKDFYDEAYETIQLTSFARGAAQNIHALNAADAALFFDNYSYNIDLQSAKRVMEYSVRHNRNEWLPNCLMNQTRESPNPFWEETATLIEHIFTTSNFSDRERYLALVALDSAERVERIKQDPALWLANDFTELYTRRIDSGYRTITARINLLYQPYMKGLMEMQPNRAFFPDANRTMRISYGQVRGYSPADAVYYAPFTTLEGVFEKGDILREDDYKIPLDLSTLHQSGEYGRWGMNGTVAVAFIANNHTTGGNSGSPVLNARGELVGINFDRTWESTMSDYEYDQVMCHNITVDIRYVLFVMDKVGGANYLLDEMIFSK